MFTNTTAALLVVGSIPTENKYLYGLLVVVTSLTVCVNNFSMFLNDNHDTEIISGVG